MSIGNAAECDAMCVVEFNSYVSRRGTQFVRANPSPQLNAVTPESVFTGHDSEVERACALIEDSDVEATPGHCHGGRIFGDRVLFFDPTATNVVMHLNIALLQDHVKDRKMCWFLLARSHTAAGVNDLFKLGPRLQRDVDTRGTFETRVIECLLCGSKLLRSNMRFRARSRICTVLSRQR